MTTSKRAGWCACCRSTGRSKCRMNAVYPHRHHLSAKVRTFIDMLVQHSAEQQKLINPLLMTLVCAPDAVVRSAEVS